MPPSIAASTSKSTGEKKRKARLIFNGKHREELIICFSVGQSVIELNGKEKLHKELTQLFKMIGFDYELMFWVDG